MFSVKGETVLDPFLDLEQQQKWLRYNERNSIGYETDPNLLPVITKKIGESNVADVKIVNAMKNYSKF